MAIHHIDGYVPHRWLYTISMAIYHIDGYIPYRRLYTIGKFPKFLKPLNRSNGRVEIDEGGIGRAMVDFANLSHGQIEGRGILPS